MSIEHDGLVLNGFYEASTADAPVVLMLHGTLAHGDMEIMSTLRGLFREEGWGALSVSLGLGESGRSGMYPCESVHRHLAADAVGELGLWLGWLEARGVGRIVLLGHSRGALQVAMFAEKRPSPEVEAVILVAPPVSGETDPAVRYRARWDEDLGALVSRAQALVDQGQGDAVLENVGFLHCSGARVTAESFLSYYGPAAPAGVQALVEVSPYPVLVVAGSEDAVAPGLADSIRPHLDPPRIELVEIDGADHFFRDLYADDVVAAVKTFVAGGVSQ